MIDKQMINGYKNIDYIRQETEICKRLLPYRRIYNLIEYSMQNGYFECYIDASLLKDKEVKEFFISEGYTISEKVTDFTVILSWKESKVNG